MAYPCQGKVRCCHSISERASLLHEVIFHACAQLQSKEAYRQVSRSWHEVSQIISPTSSWVFQGRRPAEILVAWRLRDMWPQLEKWMWEMEIEPYLETREEAMVSCVRHGTDIEGRNNPVC